MSAGHRTRALGLIFVWAMAATIFVAQPALADATSDAEACFLAKINTARAAAGAQKLTADSTLAGYARIHSKAMYQHGSIYHSSTDDLVPYLPDDWMKWGENVGVGGTCDALFEAFWASASHRENLLDPEFQSAGIGVYIDDGSVIWTTHVFLQRAPVTTTTTAPPPTTTTTHAPTTTTSLPATTTTTHATTTTTAPPATTTTTQAPTTTSSSTSTTAAPPPSTTTPTQSSTTTAAPTTSPETPTTTTGSEAPPTSETTEPRSTTTSTAGAAFPSTTTTTVSGEQPPSTLASLIGSWESDGVLCSEGRCGGDQALLAFIGVMLLGGSVLTTWSLRG